jgi:glycosyltransferase involved in cell wall biosynthesis
LVHKNRFIKDKQKILLLDSVSIIGGGQNNLLLIVNHLNINNFIPTVFCRKYSDLSILLKQYGIRTKEFSIIPNSSNSFINIVINIVNTLVLIPQLIGVVYGNKINIVDSHCYDTHIPAIIVGKVFRIPIIIHTNSYIKNYQHKILDYLTNNFADKIISISKATENKLNISPSMLYKLEVVYPSIHPNIFEYNESEQQSIKKRYNINNDKLIIGTLARISPEKGLVYLIKAFHIVKEKYPNTILFIGGEVSSEKGRKYELNLLSIINTLNLEDDIIIHSESINNVIKGEYHFQDFDICVLASTDEAFGMFILESMALGKPVVATNVGGIPEVAIDNDTAILVNPMDPIALSQAISLLIKDERRRFELGQKGKKRAIEHFSIGNTISKIEGIYEQYNK